MVKIWGLFFLLAALVVSCPDPSGSEEEELQVKIPADLMGMVHAGGRSDVEDEYALLDRLGVHWMLTDFSWSSIQPGENTWNLDAFKTYADNAESRGKKILAILDYDVGWIHDGTFDDDPFTDRQGHHYISPKEIPLFCEYVKKTVDHYKDRVDAWCIWNEPNLQPRFWADNGTKEEFFELTKAAAAAIRETAPEAFIIGGAFNTLASEAWVRGIFTSGAMEQIDAIAYHPYLVDAKTSAATYTNFKNIVADYGFGGKIWITEVGYPTQGHYGTEVPDAKMPETLIKTVSLLAAGGANHVLWYQLFDPENPNPDDSEDWFGVVKHDLSRKNGADTAYSLCGTYIPGKTWRSSLPESSGLSKYIVAQYFEGDGDNTLIIWNEWPLKTPEIKVRLPGINRRSHNPADGVSSVLAEEETIIDFDSNKTLYFFTWENPGAASQPPRISAP